MPLYQLLTDRTLAEASAITPTTLIHIVTTGDASQNPAGSSYKAELGQLVGLFNFTGGTVSGETIFTGGLSANTISATTYLNLPVTADTNFANTNLTLDNDRLHNLNGYDLFFSEDGPSFGYMSFGINGGLGTGSFQVNGSTDTTVVVTDLYVRLRQLDNEFWVKSTETVVNETGNPNDFRVETDNNQNMFFVDGTNNKVGISTNTPSETLDVSGKTKTINFQMTSGGTTGYVLSSIDNNGNSQWGNLSSLYTGNTSGTCITDLYVSNIHSCSPLNINPLDEGEVYFGSTSGVTIDVTNSRIGIGNSNPVTNLHVSGNTLVSGSLSASTLDLVSSNNLNTANNTLRFTDTDAGASDNQFSGKIEFYSSDVSGIGVKSYIGGVVSTSSQGSIIFGTTGTTGTLTGGTTVGERMRITSDGFVGIGQTSPTYTLDISSGNETTDDIALRVANDGNKGVYFAPTANNSSFNQNTISGDTVIVGSPGESLVIGSNTGYAGIRFSGGTGALAMTSTGWLGLGSQYLGDPTEQPSQQLDVEGNARFRAIGSVASAGALHYTSNGTLTTNTSDIRLKENIEPLTNSLEKILQLTGVTYNWIGETGKRIGMIAQDVEKVIPELVFTNNNTEEKIKGIHQDNLTSVLVEAIKEQQKIIEELKVRISNLES